MSDLEKDMKFLEKAISEEYSLNYILELYKSDKHSYFYFSKKKKSIFIIIFIVIIIFWLVNYSIITIITWILWMWYFLYSLWMVKWYEIWTFEWLNEWFEQWFINTELSLLKLLLINKKNNESEKNFINFLLRSLIWNFSEFESDYIKENEFKIKINEIVERELLFYSKYTEG